MEMLNSEPRRLEPGSYEYEFLYELYNGPWEYPLPEDFDDAFSYVQSRLTERERRIIFDRIGEDKTLTEISCREGMSKDEVRRLISDAFDGIRNSYAINVLKHGIKSKCAKLEPNSYEYKFLYQIYGRAWEYPLPEDFGEIFSYIHTELVSKRCQRILLNRLIKRKTLKEIAKEEGVTKDRVRQLEQKPFEYIRRLGWDQVLIHGVSYYTKDSISMTKMPLILSAYLSHNEVSAHTIYDLSRRGICTLGDLSNDIRNGLYEVNRTLAKKSLDEIRSIIDYYDLDTGVVALQYCNQYMSRGTINALTRANKNSPEILRHMSDDEILEIHGIGKNALDEIRTFLIHYDFENHRICDRSQITSDPNVRIPDPEVYKNKVLYQIYGKEWDYPIQPDFDETFSIIHKALTGDETRILYKVYAQSMALYEVADDEGLKMHNVRDIIEGAFFKIRETGGVKALIHGVSYYTKNVCRMKRMPLILALGMGNHQLSLKSIKLLSSRRLNTLGKIYEMIVSGDIYSAPEMLIDDIMLLLKDYDFYKDASLLLFCRKNFSTRAFHILMDEKILSPEILINMSQEELLKIHGIGEKTLRDIKYLLDHYDFETHQIRD